MPTLFERCAPRFLVVRADSHISGVGIRRSRGGSRSTRIPWIHVHRFVDHLRASWSSRRSKRIHHSNSHFDYAQRWCVLSLFVMTGCSSHVRFTQISLTLSPISLDTSRKDKSLSIDSSTTSRSVSLSTSLLQCTDEDDRSTLPSTFFLPFRD